MGRQFDDLSKAMARRISRGQALRGLLGGAFAAALATIIPGRALARQGSDGDCFRFCNAVYGDNSWEAHACIQQSGRGTGPCYQFGPFSPGCEDVHCPHGQICVSVSLNYSYGKGYCHPY